MQIVDQVVDAYTEAHRGNFDGLKVVALLITEAQEYQLRQEANPSNWAYEPRRGVLRYNGATVITVPDGVLYTPRVLLGDH